jgi:phthalate 4,5-dioxygenase oxygenase subunit
MLNEQDAELLIKTGPGSPMGEYMRRFWIPALPCTDLLGPDCPPVRLSILGERLVAFRDTSGKVGILDEFCPHRRTTLYWGRNEESGLRCVYHGWKYDVDGNCVDMPNEPSDSNFMEKVKAVAYPTREFGGVIWTYMGPPNKMPELPDFEFGHLPANHLFVTKRVQETNWLQALEGGIDHSHAAFLHGSFDQERFGQFMNLSAGLLAQKAPRFTAKNTDFGLLIGAAREADEETLYWRITNYWLPFYSAPAGALDPDESGGYEVIWAAWVPSDDGHAGIVRVSYHTARPFTQKELDGMWDGIHVEIDPQTGRNLRHKDNDYLIDRDMQRTRNFTGIVGIGNQDMAVVEGMGTVVDRGRERLGTSDTGIIAARRRLVREVKAFWEKGEEPRAPFQGSIYRVRPSAAMIKRDVPFEEGAREKLYAGLPKL